MVFKPSQKEDARCEAKILKHLRIATRTARIQSDAKNLLFDCMHTKQISLLLCSFSSGSRSAAKIENRSKGELSCFIPSRDCLPNIIKTNKK